MVQCWLQYKKIFTTDGRRPRSTTRFYNGFGFDFMHMTTECMEVQLCPRYEGQLNHMAEATPPPHQVPYPVRPHDTHHYSTADERAETDRLD